MNQAINASVRLFTEIFEPSGPLVEIGSLYLPGHEMLCDLRPYFKGQEYIGCDIRQGLGVDRIENAQALTFPDKSVGTVLMFELLEHLPYPEKAIAEAQRVLRDDGLIALSVPFSLHLHGFPSDYRRYTSSGVYVLLSNFPDKVIFALGPRVKPAFIFAVATQRDSLEFSEKKLDFSRRFRKPSNDPGFKVTSAF